MTVTLYGIVNCNTVKNARAWLEQARMPYAFHDFKKTGVPQPELDRWIAELGWEALVNRAGTTWRKLDEIARAAVVDAKSARALMLTQSSVIKRPVVRWADGGLTVGFSPELFTKRSR
jgi:Spx/MgsR family transcriptional regulator